MNGFSANFSRLASPILVLGGAHGGKSDLAPNALNPHAKTAVFGTCDPKEDFFKKRVVELKQSRPSLWQTFEDNEHLAEILGGLDSSYSQILIDSFNQWVASRLLDGARKYSHEQLEEHLHHEFRFVKKALEKNSAKRIVIISAEVSNGVTPPQKVPRLFRHLTAKFNCQLAAYARSVVLMSAGIPMLMKGGDELSDFALPDRTSLKVG